MIWERLLNATNYIPVTKNLARMPYALSAIWSWMQTQSSLFYFSNKICSVGTAKAIWHVQKPNSPRMLIFLQTLSTSSSTGAACPIWPQPGRYWQRCHSPGQSQQLLDGWGGREETGTGQGQGQEGRRGVMSLGREGCGIVWKNRHLLHLLFPGWSR